MDLLDFDGGDLYFEEPLHDTARASLAQAAAHYGEADASALAETWLQRADQQAPDHPLVLVALYRFFYYQHRLADALIIAERVLRVFAQRLNLPQDWRELTPEHLRGDIPSLRFYLLALKDAGLLELRLGETRSAIARLEKVAELDSQDRLGARALLEVARASLETKNQEKQA